MESNNNQFVRAGLFKRTRISLVDGNFPFKLLPLYIIIVKFSK